MAVSRGKARRSGHRGSRAHTLESWALCSESNGELVGSLEQDVLWAGCPVL